MLELPPETEECKMRPAPLVIDVQKQFFDHTTTSQSLENAIEYINAAIALFREKQLPIVSIQHVDPESGLVPGEAAFDLPESLNIKDSDLHVHKRYGNSFNKTPLEAHLRELIVTGYCAEAAWIDLTAGDATDIDVYLGVLSVGQVSSTTIGTTIPAQ
jgi:nicotinamidase-related amidase